MVELQVPALKERRGDIASLARGFAQKFSHEFGKSISGLSPRALLVLERYNWPGNVRELEHVIGRACMLTNSELLDVQDLPEALTQAVDGRPTNGETNEPGTTRHMGTLTRRKSSRELVSWFYWFRYCLWHEAQFSPTSLKVVSSTILLSPGI